MKNFDDDILNKLEEDYGYWFEDEKRLEDCKMSSKLYPYTKLFSPIQVNSIKLKNRIALGPMGNINMANEMGRPSQKMIKYFEERAKGGCGLLCSGLIHVSQHIDHTVTEEHGLTYYPRINGSRTNKVGWRDITESVHAYGSHFFIQLSAGMGRVGAPECLPNEKKFPISASMNPNFYIPEVPSLPVSDRKLKKIIKEFGQCAIDAKAQKCDGVYLHGHEGYLLEQMTNTAFNRRTLGRYNKNNWQQFGIDIIKSIRERCGDDFPIWYRIDLSLALNSTYGNKMNESRILKKFRNERTIDETLDYMKNLVEAGVDMFDVDIGCYDNWWLPHPPINMPPGCFIDIAKIAKDFFRDNNIKSNKNLDIPVMAVGKLGYPDFAERALREDKCDMIMLARPLLADPHWPNKAYEGKVDEIRPCIGDQEGCFNEFVEGGHPQCSVCPRTGNEDLISAEIPVTRSPKKVAVIGAGPAGYKCAITAAESGHTVTLFDKNEKAGGTILTGSMPKSKYDLVNYTNYMNRKIELTSSELKLKTKFKTEITVKELKAGDFDSIVFAGGGIPKTIPVTGMDNKNVIQAIDYMNNPELAVKAEKIIVVGGGVVGCEAAHMLAYEQKKNVKIIEMLPYFMPTAMSANRFYLIHYLEKIGVEMLNCTKLKEIRENKVIVSKNSHKSVPDPYNTWIPLIPIATINPFEKKIKEDYVDVEIDADLIILAMGTSPDDSMYREAVKENLKAKMYNIGDSFQTGRVFEAVKAGYYVGRNI